MLIWKISITNHEIIFCLFSFGKKYFQTDTLTLNAMSGIRFSIQFSFMMISIKDYFKSQPKIVDASLSCYFFYQNISIRLFFALNKEF
jgi:hypothetical protein